MTKMGSSSFVCIVPRLPPAIDGIGDYAHRLWQHWPAPGGEPWHFLTSNWQDVESDQWNGAKFSPLPLGASALAEVLERLETRQVLLHYVGYGYHSHGFPLGLVAGLTSWREKMPGRRLVVFFHELWSSGPPWSSVFYVRWLQILAVRRLHRLAAASLTSTRRMQLMLDAIEPGKTGLLPIPSNIAPLGEAVAGRCNPAGQNRRFRVLIFGQKGARLRTIQAHAKLLRELEKHGRLETVVVVGKEAAIQSEDVMKLKSILPASRICIRGPLAEVEIARELGAADCFLSFYPASLLTKSTAAMSALANGCPIILKEGANAAPLQQWRHFFACNGSAEAVTELLQALEGEAWGRVRTEGLNWYQANAAWPLVAASFAARIHRQADQGHAANR